MVFEYSCWWVIPMLLISGGVAWLKYRKISKLPDIPRRISLLISGLRFLVLFSLLFLLLKPTLSLLRQVVEKPLLIIAQDNSASLLNNKDSLYFREGYSASLKEKLAVLEERFAVEWLVFGQQTRKSGEITFSEHYTDISGVFDYVEDQYTHRQPEGMILLSDGVYNRGVNPRYKMTSYPVYPVILGDTAKIPDVYLQHVVCDKFNFLHTIFPLKADIVAIGQSGQKMNCILRENGKVVEEIPVTVDRDNFLQEITFQIEAKRKGLNKYTVEVETGFQERSRENNKATVYVNILDNSGKVAIYYTAPHPDIAALSEAVKVSGIYQCSVHCFTDPLAEENANLIILHNPEPENINYRKLTDWAVKRKIPVWYILTDRKSIEALSRYGKEYTAVFRSEINEYVTPAFNRNFPYFEFTEQEVNSLGAYPPVVVPFGEIRTNAGKNLFLQKVKTAVTDNGLMSFYDQGSCRTAYFWGEGLWKWRLFSYKENGNHELFNTLIFKTVNYLSSRRGNDRFIHDLKPLYDETEEVVVNVELYNESYELVNLPDVRMNLKYGDKDFDYVLNRYGDKYRLNLGNLSAGEYRFQLSAVFKGEHFSKKGVFYVRTQNPELNDMVADVSLMQEIAARSGGKSYSSDHLDRLVEQIRVDHRFTPVYKSEMKYIELGEMKWVGILLLLMLCIEWFLLKYYVG